MIALPQPSIERRRRPFSVLVDTVVHVGIDVIVVVTRTVCVTVLTVTVDSTVVDDVTHTLDIIVRMLRIVVITNDVNVPSVVMNVAKLVMVVVIVAVVEIVVKTEVAVNVFSLTLVESMVSSSVRVSGKMLMLLVVRRCKVVMRSNVSGIGFAMARVSVVVKTVGCVTVTMCAIGGAC